MMIRALLPSQRSAVGAQHNSTGPMAAEKVREDRLRRQLARMGFKLMRSRARDKRDLTFGGYQVVHMETNQLVVGMGNLNRGYSLNLDQVEAWTNGR